MSNRARQRPGAARHSQQAPDRLVRIRCIGHEGIPRPGQPAAPVGQLLAAYDPEAHDGQGWAEWTSDPVKAMTFADMSAALDCWRAVPVSRPRRPDGLRNRPLTAFTVAIERVP
jgi:hypothetical protein